MHSTKTVTSLSPTRTLNQFIILTLCHLYKTTNSNHSYIPKLFFSLYFLLSPTNGESSAETPTSRKDGKSSTHHAC
ncbi:hypothetical protein OIU78_027490 [Salix suchowensis]|nr:hypothetical protein OIU78_027490 [Salix suchowensis]